MPPSALVKPLTRIAVRSSVDVIETRSILGELYDATWLEPVGTGRGFGFTSSCVPLGRCKISFASYEAPCRAGVEHPIDFHTLQFAVDGRGAFELGGSTSIEIDRRHPVMISSGQCVRHRAGPGHQTLGITIEDRVLRDTLSIMVGDRIAKPIRFEPKIDLSSPGPRAVVREVQHFLCELDREASILEAPAVMAAYENALIMAMLFGLDHDQRGLFEPRAASDAGDANVRRIEEYIQAHADRPISMTTLCRLTGQSRHAVFRAFRKHRDWSPMQFLQRTRLEHARERLLARGADPSVTEIAYACGFTHLGRFAAAYKKRFGECPSETLRRARR